MRREPRAVATMAMLATSLLVACGADEDEVDHFSGYNKGCYSNNCDYRPGSDYVPPPPPPSTFTFEGCPKTRKDEARTGLTIDEVRALLPGRYRSCTDGTAMAITQSESGALFVDGEPLILGTCGSTSCEAGWGDVVGALRVWSDPSAFSMLVDGVEDGYVRTGD